MPEASAVVLNSIVCAVGVCFLRQGCNNTSILRKKDAFSFQLYSQPKESISELKVNSIHTTVITPAYTCFSSNLWGITSCPSILKCILLTVSGGMVELFLAVLTVCDEYHEKSSVGGKMDNCSTAAFRRRARRIDRRQDLRGPDLESSESQSVHGYRHRESERDLEQSMVDHRKFVRERLALHVWKVPMLSIKFRQRRGTHTYLSCSQSFAAKRSHCSLLLLPYLELIPISAIQVDDPVAQAGLVHLCLEI